MTNGLIDERSATAKKYFRPYKRFNGGEHIVSMTICVCKDQRRGPESGVCGNCGLAIPDKDGK